MFIKKIHGQKLSYLLGLLILPMAVFAQELVSLAAIQIKPSKTHSQFIFMLSKKTYGKVKYIPEQSQVILELENTYKNFNIKNAKLGDANVESIDSTQSDHTIKFIFTTKGKVRWKIHFLPNQKQDNLIRLQLDIISMPDRHSLNLRKTFEADLQNAFATLAASSKQIPNKAKGMMTWVPFKWQAPPESDNKKRIFKIVIDAGHGGRDTGALGHGGTAEKHVVLSIAKMLAERINQQTNMKAVLTRSGDYFVPLRDRLRLARKDNADLFIAIHADAFFHDHAEGASVYALSQRGATSEAGRWLAQQQNYSELDGVELNALRDRSRLLRYVMIDLAQTTTIRDSLRLGNKVLDALDTISELHHTQVEQAPFVVLKSPDIPSILVEVGFISNPREEKRLINPRYQAQLVYALHQGIQAYLNAYVLNKKH